MEDAVETAQQSEKETDSIIKTPDGKGIFVFRYDNPNSDNNISQIPERKPFVGKWFTHSLRALGTYILQRPAGGNIQIVEVPKEKTEGLKAVNHPIARNMDIEPQDNYLLTGDLLTSLRSIPLTVAHRVEKKYMLDEMPQIRQFLNNLRADLKHSTT